MFKYNNMCREELLTLIDEVYSSNEEYTGDCLKDYLISIRNFNSLPKKEEDILLLKYLKGDLSVKNILINSNLKIVPKIATRFLEYGIPFMDLIQIGNLCIIESLEDFKPEKGCAFKNYVSRNVFWGMYRKVHSSSSLVSLPIHIDEKIYNIIKLEEELKSDNKKLTYNDVYSKFHIDEYERLLLYIQEGFYLDKLLYEDCNNDICDVADDTYSLEEESCFSFLSSYMYEYIDCLTVREARVILVRFGFDGLGERTLEECGKYYNVTRSRIRQIEARALRKLRILERSKKRLRDYIR